MAEVGPKVLKQITGFHMSGLKKGRTYTYIDWLGSHHSFPPSCQNIAI